MPNKMLIDATHPEETRVVVLRGNRVEEFDFESANRKQLRGNIYLAKVTRVEPSLQAAFVDYGGNRHGFLAFSEIHPDYYQIPVADRQALIDEEERAARAADAEADSRAGRRAQREQTVARPRGGARRSAPHESPEPSEDGVAMAALSEQMAPEAGVPADPGEPRSHEEPTAGDEAREQPGFAEPLHAADAAAVAHAEPGPHLEPFVPAADEPRADRGDDIAPSDSPAQVAAAETADEIASPALAASDEGGDHAEHGGHGGHPEHSTPHENAEPSEPGESGTGGDTGHNITEVNGNGGGSEDEVIESVGGADAMEEVPERIYRSRRQYKIQEVIKRRQVMLVQVVKEERGTKGAALTTYLSLAGRYSVLMPNTARGGGISRKITSSEDRRRLKDIAQELEVPEGMGVILRTAGANRTKTEVKRDFEYLLRLWETVRDLTLNSTAPTLVYEEGSLVKRSIRDLYNKDIDEILVAGDEGYKDAKEFMRMLMPSHAKNVKLFRDTLPVFTRYGIESQLDAMFQPVVQLRSGGYIVLNQAEALVAIDVNSGRATREHHIEDTALKTNMEAAEEIARQLRLRDLAGLIVIDFIDMDEKRNNRTVERRLKESLKHDRARIQVGHISHFGLLEMSRQRIRSSVLESTTDKCPHCGGSGHVRSVSSVALQLLRSLEEMLLKGATHNLIVRTRTEIALYLLNHKRAHLRTLEERFRIAIMVNADDNIGGQVSYVLEKGEQVHSLEQARAIAMQPVNVAPEVHDEDDDIVGVDDVVEVDEDITIDVSEEPAAAPERALAEDERGEAESEGASEERNGRRRRRRRRGRRGDEGHSEEVRDDGAAVASDQAADDGAPPSEPASDQAEESLTETAHGDDAAESNGDDARGDADPRRRRRGRRGGRRNRRGREGEGPQPAGDVAAFDAGLEVDPQPVTETALVQQGAEFTPPHERAEQPRTAAFDDAGFEPAPAAQDWQPPEPAPPAAIWTPPEPRPQQVHPPESVQPEPEPVAVEPTPSSRRRSTVREPVAPVRFDDTSHTPPAPIPLPVPPVEPVAVGSEPEDSARPRRSGWWSRRVFGKG